MPAEGRENPLLKKGNSDAFFREKYLTKNNRGTSFLEFLLIDILFDVSLVKLNSAIIDGNHCQWQGLRRHKCPIDTDFVYDIRQSSRA